MQKLQEGLAFRLHRKLISDREVGKGQGRGDDQVGDGRGVFE